MDHINMLDKDILMVFEGPDGVGKTTQAKLWSDFLNARYVRSPNNSGDIGFIRDIILNDKSLSVFERQLLQTLSLTVNLYNEIDFNVVLDRSHISTLLYGRAQGITNHKLGIIEALSKSMWRNLSDSYITIIVVFTADRRYNSPDNDVYESTIDWGGLNSDYRTIIQNLKEGADITLPNVYSKYTTQKFQFTSLEYVIHLELDPNWDSSMVFSQILTRLQWLFYEQAEMYFRDGGI